VLDFDPVKTGNGFTELLSFQLQIPHSSVMLSVKAAFLGKEPLEEGVVIIKCVT